MIRALIAGAAVAVAVAGAALAPQKTEDARFVASVLDAVDRGQHVSLAFEWNNQFTLVFEKTAKAWVEAGAPGDRDRRRRVVALAVLIAAHEATTITWTPIAEILEWQCDQLRHGDATEFEHVWMLASIAVIEGAGDFAFLANSDINRCPNNPKGTSTKVMTCNHAAHAASRFPHDPRFRLAGLMSRVELNVYGRKPGALRNPVAPGRWPMGGLSPAQAVKRAPDSLARLLLLADDPIIGAEARLEMGVLFFNLGDAGNSLVELAAASSRSSDPYVKYLAHFTTGLIRDAQGRPDDALAAYETAIRTDPTVYSGALWLGAKYFALGRHDEAFAVVDAAFDDPRPTADPWHRRHDARFWRGYLADLQEMVRR